MAWGSLLLLAGPNGAGKTTLFKTLRGWEELASYKSLNADDRTLSKLMAAGFSGFEDTPADLLKQFFIESATEVFGDALNLLRTGNDVCLETVLSTTKYCEMVEMVIAGGGRFELFYVALRSVATSQKRIAFRVQKGGHDVPTARLEERWKRSLQFFPWFTIRAHDVTIFDNSDAAPVTLAKGRAGKMKWLVPEDTIFPELKAALASALETQS